MTVNKSDIRSLVEIILYSIVALSFLPFSSAISASVRSEVEGEGFHRTLKYYVDTGSFKNKSCHIAIFVQLPSSLYVNVDELADLRRLQKIFSCAEGEIDVELFAEKAYYQNLTICSRVTSTKTTLFVPIHQRYRFANPGGESFEVLIPKPKLLIGCKDRLKEHRISKYKICWPCINYSKKWRDLLYRWDGDDDFVWLIPVGKTSRRLEIMCITLFITLAGAAYVLSTIYKTYRLPKERKSKDN